jgi:hypothetical protein
MPCLCRPRSIGIDPVADVVERVVRASANRPCVRRPKKLAPLMECQTLRIVRALPQETPIYPSRLSQRAT